MSRYCRLSASQGPAGFLSLCDFLATRIGEQWRDAYSQFLLRDDGVIVAQGTELPIGDLSDDGAVRWTSVSDSARDAAKHIRLAARELLAVTH